MELRLGIDYTGESLSQSPENGSRHCKASSVMCFPCPF